MNPRFRIPDILREMEKGANNHRASVGKTTNRAEGTKGLSLGCCCLCQSRSAAQASGTVAANCLPSRVSGGDAPGTDKTHSGGQRGHPQNVKYQVDKNNFFVGKRITWRHY